MTTIPGAIRGSFSASLEAHKMSLLPREGSENSEERAAAGSIGLAT